MKKLLIGLLLLSPSVYGSMNYIKVAKRADRVSVLVHNKVLFLDEKGQIHKALVTCSGTYISPTVILSAAHCYEDPLLNTWVKESNGKSHQVTVLLVDAKKDLALVKVKDVIYHDYARLGATPGLGQEVLSEGNPVGFEFVVSNGIVAGLNNEFDDSTSTYMIHTSMINPGSSGGGVFDKHGRLIGVNTRSMGFFGWIGISAAVDCATIRKFLLDHEYDLHR